MLRGRRCRPCGEERGVDPARGPHLAAGGLVKLDERRGRVSAAPGGLPVPLRRPGAAFAPAGLCCLDERCLPFQFADVGPELLDGGVTPVGRHRQQLAPRPA